MRSAWHWLVERADVLWKVEWPRVGGASLAGFARSVAVALVAAGVLRLAWPRAAALLPRLLRRRATSSGRPDPHVILSPPVEDVGRASEREGRPVSTRREAEGTGA